MPTTRSASLLWKGVTSRWVRSAVGLIVSVTLLVAIASQVNLGLLAGAWAAVSPAVLLVAAMVSVVEVSSRAIRWQILLAPFARVGFGTALGYLAIGHLANTILPARLGDVTRAVLTGGNLRVSRISVLGTIAVERVADAGLLAVAIAAGSLVGFTGMKQTLIAGIIVGAAGMAGIIAAILVLRNPVVGTTRVGRFLRDHGARFLAGGRALRKGRSLALVVALTICAFGLATAIFSIVAAASGLAVPLWQSALMIAAVTLSTAIPSGPASIGPYEFVGVTLMTAMGHPAEASLLCVALVHLVALAPASLMGLAAMWGMGRGIDFARIRAAGWENGA